MIATGMLLPAAVLPTGSFSYFKPDILILFVSRLAMLLFLQLPYLEGVQVQVGIRM
jgi:hypothetical protein